MSVEDQGSGTSPSSDFFSASLILEGETVRARLVGEMDLNALPELAAAMEGVRAHGHRRVTFDLRELTFLDSSGLRFLLDRHAEARANGSSIALIPGPPAVQRVFELTGSMDHLPFIAP